MNDISEADDMWIGMKIKSKDDYLWLDGSSVNFQAWKDGGNQGVN